MITTRRILSLIVHPRDLLHSPQTRAAVELAVSTKALDILQLRTAENDAVDEVTAAGELLGRLNLGDVKLMLNHPSLELAIKTGAHGWHLKEHCLKDHDRRELLGSIHRARALNMTTGCSVHSVEAAIDAAACGMDYLQVGTMFPTLSHPDKTVLEGPSLLQQVRHALRDRSLHRPRLVAVGGVTTDEHVRLVRAAGADGIAVIRGITAALDPHAAAASYRSWLDHEINETQAV